MIQPNHKIEVEHDDEAAFINGVNNIVNSLARDCGFAELYVTRIDNWFDHKWLNYSGKSLIPYYDFGEKITVPPFNPNRVLSGWRFKLTQSEAGNSLRPLHTWKASNDNLHNRIADYTKNGFFVWYSSATEINKRGSLMVYTVQDGDVATFYAALKSDTRWRVTKVKGITKEQLVAMWNGS